MTDVEYENLVSDEYDKFLKLIGDDNLDKEKLFRFGFYHGFNAGKRENEKSGELRISRQEIINLLEEAEKQSNLSVNKGLYSSGYWQAKKEVYKKLLGNGFVYMSTKKVQSRR